MHCPNCGKGTSPEQKFCRSCGLGLEKFSQLLGEQLKAEAVEPARPAELALREKQQRVERWLGGAAATFVSLLVGLILFAIVYGVIIRQGRWLQGSVFLLLVLAAGCALGLVFYNETLKERLAGGDRAPEPSLSAPDTAQLLPEAHSTPVHGVTERTTALLAAERRRGEP